MTADELWEWLRSCRKCGKPHVWSWICTEDHEHGANAYRCHGGTWADSADGHAYHRRLAGHLFDELKREYEEVSTMTTHEATWLSLRRTSKSVPANVAANPASHTPASPST